MKKAQGRGLKWTKREENKLKGLYNITKYNELIKIFGRSKMAIGRKALTLGLKRNLALQDYHKIWTKEEEKYLTDNYKYGNLNEIAHILGRTRKSITERAKLLKITRDKELVRKNSRKYTINEDYFCKLDEGSSYIIGLMCADGNVSNTGYTVSITLHKKDSKLLENILNKMDSNYNIFFPNNENMSVLNINSLTLHNSLIKLGITPNKSKTLGCPNIPKIFVPDFIRGVMDGDGSVNTNGKRMKIVSASKLFIKGLAKMIKSLEIEHKTYNEPYVYKGVKTDFYSIVVMRKKDLKKLYHLMYDNADLYMVRKKEAFQKMGIEDKDFVIKCKSRMRPIIGIHTDTGEKIKFNSIKEACENGFCKPHLHRSLKGIASHHKNYTWKYA